jgi:hypothetical protein
MAIGVFIVCCCVTGSVGTVELRMLEQIVRTIQKL